MTNTNAPSKLLNQVRDRIRVKHYSIRTKTQYVQWIKRFILFHNERHPKEMGAAEEAFFVCAVLPHKRDGVCTHMHQLKKKNGGWTGYLTRPHV